VQDLALALVEPHEVHMGPFFQLVQVPLDAIPSLRRVNCTAQLGECVWIVWYLTQSWYELAVLKS